MVLGLVGAIAVVFAAQIIAAEELSKVLFSRPASSTKKIPQMFPGGTPNLLGGWEKRGCPELGCARG